MIDVRIPIEIKDYKEKLFFGLTARQTVYTGISLIICVPLYYFGLNYINSDLLSWIVIFISFPMMFLGFFNYNGLPAEKIFILWFKLEFYPQKRTFNQKNLFAEIRQEIINEELEEMKKKNKKSFFKSKKYVESENINNDYNTIEMYIISERRLKNNNVEADRKSIFED